MRIIGYILTTALLIVAYFFAARAGLVLKALYAGVSPLCPPARLENMICIAECVEDQATMQELVTMGVTLAQGYFYGRPCRIPTQSHHTAT